MAVAVGSRSRGGASFDSWSRKETAGVTCVGPQRIGTVCVARVTRSCSGRVDCLGSGVVVVYHVRPVSPGGAAFGGAMSGVVWLIVRQVLCGVCGAWTVLVLWELVRGHSGGPPWD